MVKMSVLLIVQLIEHLICKEVVMVVRMSMYYKLSGCVK